MTPSQTFHDHVSELRRRIAWLVLLVAVGSVAGYVFHTQIIAAMQNPLGSPLFYSSPAGSFNFILKVATSLGIMLALPFAVYHLIRFIEPALPHPVKRSLIAKVVLSSSLLALVGAAFAFFVMVPMSLHFFSSYSSEAIKPLITADSYLTFLLNQMVTFAVLSQLPLIILFINRIKPIKPSQLLHYQRHVVVAAFLLAVILPFSYDPISQFSMAVPIIFLYYFSVLLVWFTNRKLIYPEPAIKAIKGKVIKAEDLPAKAVDKTVSEVAKPVPKPAQAAIGPRVLRPKPVHSEVPREARRSRNLLRLDPLNPTATAKYNLLDLSGDA